MAGISRPRRDSVVGMDSEGIPARPYAAAGRTTLRRVECHVYVFVCCVCAARR